MSEPSSPTVRRREAAAILYADIRGFTTTLDRLESEPDGAERMARYLAAWGALRDALVRDPSGRTSRFYLANRVGDAFIFLVFERDARGWWAFVSDYLAPRFAEFAEVVKQLAPDVPTHLKVSLYSNPARRVPYFETEPMRDELVRGYTIARRDFLCTAVNRCARMDAMPEADDALLLCNEAAFRHLVTTETHGGALEPGAFDDLGERELRGFRTPERIFALRAPRG